MTCDPDAPPITLEEQFSLDIFKNLRLDRIRMSRIKQLSLKKLVNQTEFYLYTRKTRNSAELIYLDNSLLLESTQWDSSRKTVFSTHGFQSSYNSEACQVIKEGKKKINLIK